MTSEDRLSDIADYVKFLNQVHSDLPDSCEQISVLGFSQGLLRHSDGWKKPTSPVSR